MTAAATKTRRGIDLLTASISGDVDLPVAGYDLEWDGGAAGTRIFAHFTKGGVVDTAGVAKAFLWRNTAHPANQKQGYDLPFADIIDGKLQIVPRGVQAAAGGHGVGQLGGVSSADKEAIKRKISVLYGKIQAKYPEAPTSPYKKAAE